MQSDQSNNSGNRQNYGLNLGLSEPITVTPLQGDILEGNRGADAEVGTTETS